MGDYYSGEGTGTGSSEHPKGKGKDKGTAEPKGKGKGKDKGSVEEGFVVMDKDKLWRLYKKATDRRLPDEGVVDGGLMV